jgi:hypothetical protein
LRGIGLSGLLQATLALGIRSPLGWPLTLLGTLLLLSLKTIINPIALPAVLAGQLTKGRIHLLPVQRSRVLLTALLLGKPRLLGTRNLLKIIVKNHTTSNTRQDNPCHGCIT